MNEDTNNRDIPKHFIQSTTPQDGQSDKNAIPLNTNISTMNFSNPNTTPIFNMNIKNPNQQMYIDTNNKIGFFPEKNYILPTSMHYSTTAETNNQSNNSLSHYSTQFPPNNIQQKQHQPIENQISPNNINNTFNQQPINVQFQYNVASNTPANNNTIYNKQIQMPRMPPFPHKLDEFTQRLDEHQKHWDSIVAKTPSIESLFKDNTNDGITDHNTQTQGIDDHILNPPQPSPFLRVEIKKEETEAILNAQGDERKTLKELKRNFTLELERVKQELKILQRGLDIAQKQPNISQSMKTTIPNANIVDHGPISMVDKSTNPISTSQYIPQPSTNTTVIAEDNADALIRMAPTLDSDSDNISIDKGAQGIEDEAIQAILEESS